MTKKAATQTIQGAPTLRDWFAAEPGLAVASAELELAADVLSNLFGYHILQLGNPYRLPLISCSRIQNQVVLGTSPSCDDTAIRCMDDALPVQAASVDVLVLPHVLEFARAPHAVLREAERVLIPEGHLAILGFNPWSWYGLWRRAAGWRGQLPWRGRFVSMTRLRDWLTLLGFEIERSERLSFRPPLSRPRLHARLETVERLGQHFWPAFGNVYFVLARKRVIAIRPIRARWAKQRRLPAAGVIEPTTSEAWPQESNE
jgi:SAM-dependent methyltransferase